MFTQKNHKSVEEAQNLLGNEWYLFHFGQSVGVFYGSISFSLKNHSIYEHQTELNHFDSTLLIPESINLNCCTYLHISFHFRDTRRFPFDDDWKKMVRHFLDSGARKRVRKLKQFFNKSSILKLYSLLIPFASAISKYKYFSFVRSS